MFVPRALKVKKPLENPPVQKKCKITVKEHDVTPMPSCSATETPEDVAETCQQQPGDLAPSENSSTDNHAETESPPPNNPDQAGEPAAESSDDEEPVKAFKKNQRWPEPGEPVCVMCGRYGEYICDSTDNDVCSLECKGSHLSSMGKGLVAEILSRSKPKEEKTACSSSGTAEEEHHDQNYCYKEDEFISSLTEEQVQRVKRELGIVTAGQAVARPIIEFAHCQFPPVLSSNLNKAGYEAPTPVQMQMLPVALGGRDVLASADTGSGKTVAFLLPLVVRALEVTTLSIQDRVVSQFNCHNHMHA